MGADLTIKIINEPLKQKYEPLFAHAVRRRDALPERSQAQARAQRQVGKYYDLMYSQGYFRDSYNATCVLATLGLSWWADVKPLLTKDRNLEGENLLKFRAMVASATQRLPTKAELKALLAHVADDGTNGLAEWHRYYVEKRAGLLAFLDLAIQRNTGIHCSV